MNKEKNLPAPPSSVSPSLSKGPSIALLLAIAALALAVAAGEAGTGLSIPIEQFELDNGLRVVLSENHASPTVGVALYYDVGSRNEMKGRSGFAHLFEHMMFQGSKNVGKAEHFQIINANGGVMNGTTSEDRTNYFESLPSPMLPIALWLEADRMRSLAITPENFENQRATVKEEKRESYDNQPYVPSYLEINRIAFEGYWPYEHSTIGSMEDLGKATVKDAQDFFDAFYTPANAVLAIAGDFEPATAKKLVEEHFGDIVSHEPPKFTDPDWVPPTEEVYDAIEDPLAPLPAFHMAYHIPPMRTPDFYPMTLIARALGDGESSRLERELIKEKGVVVEMMVGVDGRRGPDLLSFFCILSGAESPAGVRARIEKHIADITANGLGKKEHERVLNRLRMAYFRMLGTNLRLALILGRYKLYWNDPGAVNTEMSRYEAVTGARIREVAAKYLRESNRAVLDVFPPGVLPGEEGSHE
jgi:predicted Zn-dependent peptidase